MSKASDINLKHRKHILDQLKAFKKDKSYFSMYKGIEPGVSECLIRMFRYQPPKELRISQTLIVPNPSGITGANPEKKQEFFYNDVIMPYGVVINPGEVQNVEYKSGDLVAFFSDRISAMVDNPKFALWLQALEVQGAYPKGEAPTPQIPAIIQNYANFRINRPGNIYPDEDDELTFLLPSFEYRPYRV